MTDPALSRADQQAAADLACKIAKAAGRQRPAIMLHACYMLMQCAAMTGAPDAYIDWKIKIEAKQGVKP
jgi:hypothetical protein